MFWWQGEVSIDRISDEDNNRLSGAVRPASLDQVCGSNRRVRSL
jgi:hypothetical protein